MNVRKEIIVTIIYEAERLINAREIKCVNKKIYDGLIKEKDVTEITVSSEYFTLKIPIENEYNSIIIQRELEMLRLFVDKLLSRNLLKND